MSKPIRIFIRPFLFAVVALLVGAACLVAEASATDLKALGFVNVLDYGADPTGTSDSTLQIRRAIKAAYAANKPTFFPSGTYLVSDTLEMRTSSGRGYELVGSTRGRVTIRLLDGAPGFQACADYPYSLSDCVLKATVEKTTCSVVSRPSVKPVIDFWRESAVCPGEREFADGANTYSHVLKHIDIVLGNNPGAVGLRESAAEMVLVEDVAINATGGLAGMYEMSASGALLTDIRITGGQHGIYAPKSRGGAALITGLTLRDQLSTPIVFDYYYPLTLVGFDIDMPGSSPVIYTDNRSRSGEHLALVDGVLRACDDTGIPFIDNVDRSIYLKNVYVTGARTLVVNGDGSTLSVPDAAQTYRVGEYSYNGDFATRYGDFGKLVEGINTDDTYLNGLVTSLPDLEVSETAAIPADLQTRHTLSRTFCDIEDPEILNVKDYGVAGNGSDDTTALQAVIDLAEAQGTDTVLLPPRTYRLSDTLELRAHTQLCGTSLNHVAIVPGGWNPSAPTPMIRSADDPASTAAISELSINIPNPNLFALHWRSGRDSVVHRVLPNVNWGVENAPNVRNRFLISDNGGGRWYGLIQGTGGAQPQHPDLRTIKIDGTREPLAFYVFHTQYVKPSGNPMVEVRNSENVNFYGGKHELMKNAINQDRFPPGTLPFVLGIYNSHNIGVYGMEGRSWTDVDDAVIEVQLSSDVTIANVGERSFSEYYYPESEWYQIKEITPGGSNGVLATSFVALYKSASPFLIANLVADTKDVTEGQPVALTWSSAEASACTGTGFDTNGATSGTLVLTPAASTTFTLACSNGAGDTARMSVSVMVKPMPLPTLSLSASAATVTRDDPVKLSWSATDAKTCTGTGFATNGATVGTATVNVAATSTFTVACSNALGRLTEKSIAVTALPMPTVSLAADRAVVTRGQPTTLSWSSTDAVSCFGTGFSTGQATSGTVTITRNLTSTFTVRCGNAGDGDAEQSVTVTVVPLPKASLVADAAKVTVGQPLTLTWSSTDATACTGSGFDTTGATAGSVAVTPAATATFGLSCANAAGDTIQKSVTVTALSLPTVSLAADREAVTQGRPITLTWSSTDAAACSGSGFVTGGKTSGAVNVTRYATTTFAVTCRNAVGGTTERSVTVTVLPLPKVSLAADAAKVTLGQPVTLTWSSTDATVCTGSGFDTAGTTSGSVAVSPAATATFTLACSNAAGGSARKSVTVTPLPLPTVSFAADRELVTQGQPIKLTWSSAEAAACSGSGLVTGGKTSGAVTVTRYATTTFAVTCRNAVGGTTQQSLTVTTVPLPKLSLASDAAKVTLGQPVTLTWSSTDATACTGTGFDTERATAGSVAVSPAANTTFTLVCSNAAGGIAQRSVAVMALPVPTVSLAADRGVVTRGQPITLTWSSTDAAACSASGFATEGATAGAVTVTRYATSTFTVTCRNAVGSASEQSVTVTAVPLPTLTLVAERTTVTPGEPVALNWSSQGSKTCWGAGFATRKATNGTATLTPNATSTFRVTCGNGAGGKTEKSVTVTVVPLPTVTLVAKPSAVSPGQPVTLSWSSQDANACVGIGFATERATRGTASVTRNQTSTFGVRCLNAAGGTTEKSVMVTVLK